MSEPYYVGIDVSIDRLDVAIRPGGRGFCVTNDAAGWAELVARLPQGAIAAIGLEPSGGYERGIVRVLLAAGFSVRRINPNKLRQFARAAGALAKNDRIDARLIADYVTVMPTRVVERNPAVERLAETVTMRRQLCDEHIAVESQASHLEDALLQRIAKRRLTRIEADIVLLDKRLAELVAAQPDLARRFRLLCSMPGVGPTLAYTLLALMPELGQIGRKQIAALVGLAPYAFDSGRFRGQRHIYGGRIAVRNTLYMPALAAIRFNPALRSFHRRLVGVGKKPKVVIVAVMRKMLTTLCHAPGWQQLDRRTLWPAHRAGHLTAPAPSGRAESRPQPRTARWRAASVSTRHDRWATRRPNEHSCSPVAARSGDRLLSEPEAGTQPSRREPLFMPLKRLSRQGQQETASGGFLSFASTRSGDKVAAKAAIRRDRPAGSAMVVAPAT